MFNDSSSVEDLSAQHLAQGLATLPSLPDSSLEMQSPAFIACRLLDSSHPGWRVMVPHCGFDLHFSDNE